MPCPRCRARCTALLGDPPAGSAKTCYVMGAPPLFTAWTSFAAENSTCIFTGTHEVAYGANGQ